MVCLPSADFAQGLSCLGPCDRHGDNRPFYGGNQRLTEMMFLVRVDTCSFEPINGKFKGRNAFAVNGLFDFHLVVCVCVCVDCGEDWTPRL